MKKNKMSISFVKIIENNAPKSQFTPSQINDAIKECAKIETAKDPSKHDDRLKEIAYEVIAIMKQANSDHKLIIEDLKAGRWNWNSHYFKETRDKITKKKREEVSEEEVKEGLEVCPNPECKSRRIVIEQRQTRSGDEGATNFYTCSNCGRKWQRNN